MGVKKRMVLVILLLSTACHLFAMGNKYTMQQDGFYQNQDVDHKPENIEPQDMVAISDCKSDYGTCKCVKIDGKEAARIVYQKHPDHCHIVHLTTEPIYRRYDYAHRLLHCIYLDCSNKNYIDVYDPGFSYRAIDLYRSEGFKYKLKGAGNYRKILNQTNPLMDFIKNFVKD